MMRVKNYCILSQKMDELVESGMNSWNPIIRSIGRQLAKLYSSATDEEKREMDCFDNIPFR